jgi:hypothetical protein
MNKSQIPDIVRLIKPYYDLELIGSKQLDQADRFGFYLSRIEPSELILQQILSEILDNRATQAWTVQSHENLKQLIREFGIPNSLRPKLWLGFIQNEISNAYNASQSTHVRPIDATH